MSKQIAYKSVFAPYFNSFLNMKETMGYGLIKFQWILLELDRFFVDTGTNDTHITSQQIATWSKTRVNDKERTLYDKYSIVSQFCRYMCHVGVECYIPRLPKQKDIDFIPYVFTHQQMENIFRECDNLVTRTNCMNSSLFAMPALVRFLYSTGVRISEAISFKNGDVDYARHQVIIRKTKNKMQRIVPLNACLIEVMKQYESYRNRMPIEGISESERPFFVSPIGSQITKGTVYKWFKLVLEKCGIPHIGKHQGPRVHDIRHSCAVHSLVKLVKEEVDIYCALPILSTFLGHKTIIGTERYVRLVQEMYPEIIKMQDAVTSFIFPHNPEIEIDYGNNN